MQEKRCSENEHMGLSYQQAIKSLNKYGKNRIADSQATPLWQKWLIQFNNPLIYILLLAALTTGYLNQLLDSAVIILVVLINAVIGFVQETKAEHSLYALKQLLSLRATVIRDGRRIKIDAELLVPDDLVYLQAGDKVPADIELVEAFNIQVDESLLTGESLPVEKKVVENSENPNRRINTVFSGTVITYGTCYGKVVKTGQQTELGKISSALSKQKKFTTPFLDQLQRFGKWLIAIIGIFLVSIIVIGIFIHQYPFNEIFIAAIAMTVSVIPEGLPAIITIAMAVAVTRMSKLNAITRRLASVETLSSVSVIFTDKTGTLTCNELAIASIITDEGQYAVTGQGYQPEGEIIMSDKVIVPKEHTALYTLILTGVVCNEAQLSLLDEKWQLSGNPVDGAFLALGLKAGMNREAALQNLKILDSFPFSSEHKYMAMLCQMTDGDKKLFIKGAPEKLLAMSKFNSREQSIEWQKRLDDLASKGMRVLAVATLDVSQQTEKIDSSNLSGNINFIGLVGIIDPPRKHVKQAIKSCQNAGIKVKMVTGDHALTAKYIAKQIGLDVENVITGDELDKLDDKQLRKVINNYDVFARTVPEHKLRLVKSLQEQNQVVAMTGDGVNDAPALKKADIGIAMGVKGTEVAKEASEMVLADDNFATIKNAVKQARTVYSNIKKTILFILPNDGAEGLCIFFAMLFGYTLPITPIQILWVNMVTAVTLALALAFEKSESDVMMSIPRKAKEPILSGFLIWRIIFVSILFVCSIFWIFISKIKGGCSVEYARTIVVNTLVLLEAAYLINCRSIYKNVCSISGIFGSKPVWIAIGITVGLQILFTYLPAMQFLFATQPISLFDWSIISFFVFGTFIVIEIEKFCFRYFL